MPTPKTPLPKNLKIPAQPTGPKEPLWLGPEDASDMGGVSQSIISRFLVCRERFRLRYIKGITGTDKWDAKSGFGNMWHVCEEAHSANKPIEDPLLKHAKEQADKYKSQQEEIDKWYNVVKHQFPVYVDHWDGTEDVKNRKPLEQEKVFHVSYALPSGRVVYVKGKRDAVDIIGNGKLACLYLQENKTKGKIVERLLMRQLRFDLQTMLYLVAMYEQQKINELGSKLPIKGVRYNVIRRDLPIKQHMGRNLKSGYKAGETMADWCNRLVKDYFRAEPTEWFMRWRVEVSARDVELFKHRCLNPVLEQICEWYEYVTTGDPWRGDPLQDSITGNCPASGFGIHWQHPFGVYNVLNEGGADDLDEYIETGSMVGLRFRDTLFEELQ